MRIAELWRKGQEGWPRSYPVVQFPNATLVVAFAGLGIAAASDGTPHDIARALYYSGLGVWAAMELVSGANGFRRVVGAGGLTWIAFRLSAAVSPHCAVTSQTRPGQWRSSPLISTGG